MKKNLLIAFIIFSLTSCSDMLNEALEDENNDNSTPRDFLFTVSGQIVSDDMVFEGVTVTINSTTVLRNTMTDKNGRYSFNGIPSGEYSITPSREGYFFYPSTKTISIKHSTENVNFYFRPAYWSVHFGGHGIDVAESICQTNDNGYVFAGSTNSQGNGLKDLWIVKISTGGDIIWERTFGGRYNDVLHCIYPTFDGGFIAAGYTSNVAGSKDAWFLKLDNAGSVKWYKILGGLYDDELFAVNEIRGIGYLAVGYTCISNDNKDAYFVLVTAEGAVLWEHSFGNTQDENLYSIAEVDNDYFLAGYTASKGNGKKDSLLLKINATGNVLSEIEYGSSEDDETFTISKINNNTFLMGGTSGIGSQGVKRFWLFFIDASGNRIWEKFYGASGINEIRSIYPLSNGFVFTGVIGNDLYNSDVAIIKTDALGEKLWQKTYGGFNSNKLYSIIKGHDKGFIVAGYSQNLDGTDTNAWIMSLNQDGKY